MSNITTTNAALESAAALNPRIYPGHLAGIWAGPLVPRDLYNRTRALKTLGADERHLDAAVGVLQVKGIAGGIRNPHLHLGDNEVLLLTPESFKSLFVDHATTIADQMIASFDSAK